MRIRAAGPKRAHSDYYDEYLNSPVWRQVRAQALARAGHVCSTPGCEESHALEVHHLSYDHLGGESWSELEVLCPDCHEAADRRRRGLGRL